MKTVIPKRNDVILMGGILIALLFYPVVVHFVFYYQKNTLATKFYHYLFIWLEVFVLYLYSRKVEVNNFFLWPEKKYKALFYILSIAVLFLLQVPGNFIAKIPTWLLGWDEIWHTDYSIDAVKALIKLMVSWYHLNLAILIFCSIARSTCAEVIFRGYLLPRLSNLLKNKIAAIIISSLLFAVFPYGGRLKYLISDFISGTFFAIHYQKYRNIKVLIVSRILIDLAVMLIVRGWVFSWQLSPHQHRLLYFLMP